MEMSMQEELDRPMILAVKYHLKEPRTEVAYKLAKYLKFPLVDQDEIAQVLQDSQLSSDISFEIVLKIASTQLTKLKLGVIISTPISQNTHLDKLKHLATSSDAILVIIQCLPEDASSDYEIVGVSKLTVETEKQDFVAEDFVSNELDKVKRRIYRHLHPLIFNSKPCYGTEGHCQSCQRIIQGPSYQCILGCDEYLFDKACAELLGDLDQVRKNCPEYLRVSEPEYLFPRKLRQKCNVCVKEFSDSCHDCLFRTNMRGEFLPIIVNHESHAHPLNLVMMPLSYNYEFACAGCGEFGHSISYRCYDCNFNLHVSCVLLPRTVSYNYDKHPLMLTYDSPELNYLDKSYCEACKKEMNPEHWFYYCPVCESATHLDCVSNQSSRY